MKYTGFILMVVLLTGCLEPVVFEKSVDIINAQWNVTQTPSFEFEISDTSKSYDVYYLVRSTMAYPYHNLYVKFYLEDTLGHPIASDLHNMNLFDPKTGEPLGSGLGDIKSQEILALPQYRFSKAGIYRLKIEQYMRVDPLPSIISFGISVRPSNIQ